MTTPLWPLELLQLLVDTMRATDNSPDADGDQHEDAACEAELCEQDRRIDPSPDLRLLDLQIQAAAARYSKMVDGRRVYGAIKRTAFPRADLSRRRVVIVLHQVGVEVSSSWPSAWKVTAHGLVRPDGVVAKLHPLDVRLTCSNRVDRSPWHAIGIEFAGNFEGLDGSGNWALPDRNGRGRASDAQIVAGRLFVEYCCEQVRLMGGKVVGILPHRTTGRDSRGRPNRQICPGSRVWSEVGEWAGAMLGLSIPGPAWALGGLTIPQDWHGRYFDRCHSFL